MIGFCVGQARLLFNVIWTKYHNTKQTKKLQEMESIHPHLILIDLVWFGLCLK